MGLKEVVKNIIGRQDEEVETLGEVARRYNMRAEQPVIETHQLILWENGHLPNLKVNLFLEDDHIIVALPGTKRGLNLGDDTDVLTKIGYRINVHYRRDYFDHATGEIMRHLSRREAERLPTRAMYFSDAGLIEAPDGGKVWPLENPLYETGGKTEVVIYAPSGHWARGVAYCSDDDNFDHKVGRKLAFKRALESLNEVVNG